MINMARLNLANTIWPFPVRLQHENMEPFQVGAKSSRCQNLCETVFRSIGQWPSCHVTFDQPCPTHSDNHQSELLSLLFFGIMHRHAHLVVA